MKLPNGVTGFYDSEYDRPPTLDGKHFKTLCFDLAIRNGGKVISFHEPRYPANFYEVQMEVFGLTFYVLLNAHYPYLAFASAVDMENIEFIDSPVPCEFLAPPYRVMSKAELYAPFTQREGAELNKAELEQIAYWKPETIGEVLFNHWD